MKLTQSWVGYLDRSYQQIKASVLQRLVINNPEITDHNESNILIIIIDLFAGIGEMINYYIDRMAREGFLGTAQKYTSVVKLVRIVDYNIKANTMASATLLFQLKDNNGNPVQATTTITIPKDTQVTDANGVLFRTLVEVHIIPGQSGVYATAQNWQDVTNSNFGVTNGLPNQQFILPSNYVDGSLSLNINGEPWVLYESDAYMMFGTEGIFIRILEDGNAYMFFGNGVNGMIPDAGLNIIANYRTSNGAGGNLPPNAINQVVTVFSSIPNGTTMTAVNQDYSNGGSGFESIDDIRDRAPRSVRTNNRAVTFQDFLDLARQVPEVGSADGSYCCGKAISIYVSPKTIGIATPALTQKVTDYLNCRKSIRSNITVFAAGITKVWIQAVIYAKELYTANATLIEVMNLLAGKYGYVNSDINTTLSVSDIIGTIEGAKSVDRVDVQKVQVLPYAGTTGQNPNTSALDIEFTQLPTTAIKSTYTITFKSATNQFQIFKGAANLGTVGYEQIFNDGTLAFKIHSASYQNNDQWSFVVTPSYPEIFPSTLINIADNTVPIIDIGTQPNSSTPPSVYGNFTVVTKQNQSNCQAPCPQ